MHLMTTTTTIASCARTTKKKKNARADENNSECARARYISDACDVIRDRRLCDDWLGSPITQTDGDDVAHVFATRDARAKTATKQAHTHSIIPTKKTHTHTTSALEYAHTRVQRRDEQRTSAVKRQRSRIESN